MRLIDADSLVEQLSGKAKEMGIAEQSKGLAINYYTGAQYGFTKSAIIANGLPTIEQKRGKWMPYEFGDYRWHKCSVCGKADKYIDTIGESVRNYCPNCGARMSNECAD